MLHRTRFILLCIGAAAALAPVAVALVPGLTEQPVRATARSEITPAAARTGGGVQVLAWAESRNGRPESWHAYIQKGSGAKVKLDNAGYAFAGGMDLPWVVYQQVVRGNSDVKLYRLDKRKRIPLPAGVNTRAWEWGPGISGKWILFARGATNARRETLILFNRQTGRSRIVVTENSNSLFFVPGQINGNWVVWTKCNASSACDGFIYNLVTRTTTKLPKPANPTPLVFYGLAVTKTGVVYAGLSELGCGNAARIVRYRRGDDPATGTALAPLAAAVDFAQGFARTNPNGTVDFFYDRRPCSGTSSGDIYKITDPPPP